MPIRQTLPAVLRGDEAAALSPEDRRHLETMAERAQSERELAFVRDECGARLRQPDPPLGVSYLLAEICARNGEVERAHQTLLALGERLAADRRWEPLAAVADHALALEESQAAARLLVAAHEGLGRDPERIEALGRAAAILSDDLELGLLRAVRLGETGRGEERRALLAELLPRFADADRHAGLEEAALEFVEHGDLDGLQRLVAALPVVAGRGGHAECRQLLDIAFPPLADAGRAGAGLDALRALLARTAETTGEAAAEAFRGPLAESLRQGPARELPDPEPVLRLSGIDDPARPVLAALERFDAIAALPPGSAVHHASFGAGRVTLDDGETVAIDFAHASGHRMPYEAARRTLSRIAEDDLRLLLAKRPDALAELLRENPAEILWRALRALGGAADAQKLKVFLVGSKLVPAAGWTAFWRRARSAADRDPRIDCSRAFEQRYAAASGEAPGADADATPLPPLEPSKPARANLATIRKFLAQHPQAEPALARRFARYVERIVFDEESDRVDRARAGLHVARWLPERAADWAHTLRKLWEQGLAVSDLSGEDEQAALLDASHAAGVESDAILSALDSRFSSVRRAAQALRDRLDAHGWRELRLTLLRHAPRYPAAALRLVEEELAGGAPGDGWQLFCASLSLIQERPKPSTAEKVLRWIAPGSAFDGVLAGQACPEDSRLQIRVLLREWRASDRFLFPALEAVERLGLADEAAAVRAARQHRTERLFERVGQQAEDTDLPVMTRATWERLHRELERLQRELKTTIPAAIRKARELGDLRENAEYHSAKLKQANVGRLVRSLQSRLSRARFVDDVEHKDGIVGLGTEVVLESGEDLVTYWILGEGEHAHGGHVVSFQAPVGRALVGRSIGDEVELGEGDRRRRYRVVSVERKLPPPGTSAAG